MIAQIKAKGAFIMQISNQIDQLIQALNELKPLLSDDKNANSEKFANILEDSLNHSIENMAETTASEPLDAMNKVTGTPAWVNPNYGYDPENPRKPNMRELMEAIAGKSVEDLYAEPDGNWVKISREASDMLYGVVGSNVDTRDWPAIMAADNILEAARKETEKMYSPKIEIKSEFNNENILTNQVAVIKDKNDNILRILSNNIPSSEETLKNFGATNASIPSDFMSKIVDEKFDKHLSNFLENFDTDTKQINTDIPQLTAEAISNKIMDEITLVE
jgi:hypothetical protein